MLFGKLLKNLKNETLIITKLNTPIKMETIAKDNFREQLINVKLFLSGKRLKGAHLSLYIILLKKAAFNGSYSVNTPINLISSSLAFSDERTINLLNDLKK